MTKFWDFIRDDEGERILRLEGPIDEDDLWGDAVTPEMFRDELEAEEGDVTVWLNSPGGNVFAANQIYNMLCDHKGKITVKIDAIAASAASVIAMAGDRVLMSPVSMLMIHDPMTIAMGNAKDMEKAISTLNEVKESIINAYQRKTGLSRNKIAQLMSDETWLNAKKAVEMHFADEILFAKDTKEAEKKDDEKEDGQENAVTVENAWKPFHARLMVQSMWARLSGDTAGHTAGTDEESEKPASDPQDVEPSETGMTDKNSPIVDKDPPKKEGDDNSGTGSESGSGSGGQGGKADKPEKPDEDDPDDPDEPEDPDRGDDPDGADQDDDPDQDDPDEEEPEKEPPARRRRAGKSAQQAQPSGDSHSEDTKDILPGMPVIGMDGKTKDGSMPYELLERELQLLK